MKTTKPVTLIILDGYGITLPSKGNAISLAQKPVIDDLVKHYPHTLLEASGEVVGLPWGEFGNSEVGHMNIGSGRVMYQDLLRIDKAVQDGSFFSNEALQGAIKQVKEKGSRLHLVGLVSPGGVHSHLRHLYALLELAQKEGLSEVYIHAFLDGRDMPPQSGLGIIQELEAKMKELGVGKIASVAGRYYGMDRDKNWDRVKKAYDVMVTGQGSIADSAVTAIEKSYGRKIYDEEFEPVVIAGGQMIGGDDAVIHFNYRSDRGQQLAGVFVDPEFSGFERLNPASLRDGQDFSNLYFTTLTNFGLPASLPVKIAFPLDKIKNTLGEVLAQQGLKQLRIAETEKYAHVTNFFNCGQMDPFSGEDRQLIPSPGVKSYAEKPEMSAYEVTDKFLELIDNYDFALLNFANIDMVGHTGDIPATTKAIETVDKCLGKIVKKVQSLGGSLIIAADHGNADLMLNLQTDEMMKEHTVNPVPCIIVDENKRSEHPAAGSNTDLSTITPTGVLSDVAPTVLGLMGIDKPEEMTGMNLSEVI
ncbi:MAG: 2,3-bisphosphoglycerate-independent phosphoglycerate mutase [Candidatus Marinimicrobia bacterium]|nr:2,3-bisphosphoglycerate-independent phosphoglycerate mutase [Candidatus Neomarinimicrobiota bacterium]